MEIHGTIQTQIKKINRNLIRCTSKITYQHIHLQKSLQVIENQPDLGRRSWLLRLRRAGGGGGGARRSGGCGRHVPKSNAAAAELDAVWSCGGRTRLTLNFRGRRGRRTS